MSQEIEPRRSAGPRVCTIADALDIVGERWSLPVLGLLRQWGERYAAPARR